MRKLQYLCFFLALCFTPIKGQVYLHPTAGIAGEFVGSCEVATCTGTYYDNGGIGGSTVASGVAGNYSNNINGAYRVFCPNAAGQCLQATFTQFSTEGGAGCPYEYFQISNGSTQNSPVLWAGCGTGAIGPFTGTANGCLTFRFWSDNIVNRAGWAVNFSCTPCAGAPNGTDNNDCVSNTPICAAIAVPANSTGPGIVDEACGGGGCPAGGENYSNWYTITFATSGTFNFLITPTVATDDYDYSIYGPNAACGGLGSAIRCSDASATGITGLAAAAGDLTEDVTGDKFTNEMNVIAGETYFIMIDEWTPTGAGYVLTLGGTAIPDCTSLPVEISSFKAKYDGKSQLVNLLWSTLNEVNNDYFAIEKSIDGVVFEELGIERGKGSSSLKSDYKYVDHNPFPGEINYYRLRQVDYNGKIHYSGVEAVAINNPDAQFSIYPNPANEDATILFNTAHESEYHLRIYDYTTKLMLSYYFRAEKGNNIIPLDLSRFNKGVYFVTLSGNGDMLKNTFIKE